MVGGRFTSPIVLGTAHTNLLRQLVYPGLQFVYFEDGVEKMLVELFGPRRVVRVSPKDASVSRLVGFIARLPLLFGQFPPLHGREDALINITAAGRDETHGFPGQLLAEIGLQDLEWLRA